MGPGKQIAQNYDKTWKPGTGTMDLAPGGKGSLLVFAVLGVQMLVQFVSRVMQVLFVHDVIPIKHAPGLVARNQHSHLFRHARANKVPNPGSAQVMEQRGSAKPARIPYGLCHCGALGVCSVDRVAAMTASEETELRRAFKIAESELRAAKLRVSQAHAELWEKQRAYHILRRKLGIGRTSPARFPVRGKPLPGQEDRQAQWFCAHLLPGC